MFRVWHGNMCYAYSFCRTLSSLSRLAIPSPIWEQIRIERRADYYAQPWCGSVKNNLKTRFNSSLSLRLKHTSLISPMFQNIFTDIQCKWCIYEKDNILPFSGILFKFNYTRMDINDSSDTEKIEINWDQFSK